MKRIALATIALVFLPAAFIVTDAADTRPACERLAAWTTAHAGALPATLDDLEAFTVAQRRSIFDALAPTAKASILREHLGRFRDRDPRFIDSAIARITPEALVDEARRQELADNVRMEAVALFGTDGARPIVGMIGGDPRPTRSIAAMRLYLSDALRNAFTVQAQQADCHCSSSSDWCANDYECVAGGCNRYFGCGTLWLYWCNGWCTLPGGGDEEQMSLTLPKSKGGGS